MFCRHANSGVAFETLCRFVTFVSIGIVAMGLVDGDTPGKVRVGLFLVSENEVNQVPKGVEGAALDAGDESGEKHGGIREELLFWNGFHCLEVGCIGVRIRIGAAAAAVMVRATLLLAVGMGMGMRLRLTVRMTGRVIVTVTVRSAHFHI